MSKDRFGNDQVVIGIKTKKGQPDSFPRGYFEFKGQLFKVTTSPSNKEGVHEWVTVTAVSKSNSQFGKGQGSNRNTGGFGGKY